MEAAIPIELITRVDGYIDQLFNPPDRVLQAALEEQQRAGLPSIQITANQGKLLYLLAKICGARAILEIGTLGGYSTMWLGRALPSDGRLITLEMNRDHAQVAQRNLDHAGLAQQVTIRLGRAMDELERMISVGEGPFDLVFIDADKPSYPAYLRSALQLTRSGSLILADNVIRGGDVLDLTNMTEIAQSIRQFNAELAVQPEIESTVVLHFKGTLDGMTVSRVR